MSQTTPTHALIELNDQEVEQVSGGLFLITTTLLATTAAVVGAVAVGAAAFIGFGLLRRFFCTSC